MIQAWQRILYRLGWYRFHVCEHAFACKTEDDWIKFIDIAGEWLPNGGRIPYFMPEWIRKLGVELKDDGKHYDAGTYLEPRRE